jgi:hypothetical protein
MVLRAARSGSLYAGRILAARWVNVKEVAQSNEWRAGIHGYGQRGQRLKQKSTTSVVRASTCSAPNDFPAVFDSRIAMPS